MTRDDFEFTVEAVERMAERGVLVFDVIAVVESGEVIEVYPADTPFPSQLSFRLLGEGPLHVVWATNPRTNKVVVITTYWASPVRWEADFKTRRK